MTTNYNMIIDTSGSMGMRISQEEEMKDYCMLDLGKILMMSFVKSLQKNDSISLISFSSSIKKICSNIKIDSEDTISNVMEIIIPNNIFFPSGTTSMYMALCSAIENIKSCENNCTKNIIILLTDGIPSDVKVEDFITKLTNYNTTNGTVEFELYTFSIGNQANSKFLSELSTYFGGTNVFVSDIGMAASTFIHTITNIKAPRNIHPNKDQENISKIFVNGIEHLIHYCNTKNLEQTKIQLLNMKVDLTIILEKQPDISLDIEVNSKTIPQIVKELLDEVEMSCTQEYFNTWGKHYLYSLQSAHQRFECHNFVDKSVSIYIDLYPTEWENIREDVENIYNKVPIQDPCYPIRNLSNSQVITPTISLQSYGNSIGCLHEDSKVSLKQKSYSSKSGICSEDFKYCKDLELGDEVLVLNQGLIKTGKIEYIIKSKTQFNTKMIKIPNGCIITPWHPVWYENKYVFPSEIFGCENITEVGEYIYSFVLENRDESMIFDGIPAVNLAHNIQNGIAHHNFWGSEKVLQCYLRYKEKTNIITINNPYLIRDLNNEVFLISEIG